MTLRFCGSPDHYYMPSICIYRTSQSEELPLLKLTEWVEISACSIPPHFCPLCSNFIVSANYAAKNSDTKRCRRASWDTYFPPPETKQIIGPTNILAMLWWYSPVHLFYILHHFSILDMVNRAFRPISTNCSGRQPTRRDINWLRRIYLRKYMIKDLLMAHNYGAHASKWSHL